MNLTSFKNALAQTDIERLEISFEGGGKLEPHFHITEVGKVTRDFVDCGGVLRKTETCLLQTLVADDTDHRLSPKKLLGIIEKAALLGLADDVEIELEIQGSTIETYRLANTTGEGHTLRFKPRIQDNRLSGARQMWAGGRFTWRFFTALLRRGRMLKHRSSTPLRPTPICCYFMSA